VDVNNTYTVLANNSNQLNSVLNLQNTLLSVGLNHDCTVFGVNDICVAVGGSYTSTSNPNASGGAANLRVAYRFHPQMYAGIFVDQSIANSMPSNYALKNGQPMAGLFAAWSPSQTNIGPSAKVSVAYSNQGASIARTTLAFTEAGSGNSAFVGQGAQAEGAWGFGFGDDAVAQPFAGVRAIKVSRNSYSESGTLGFPISYNAVTQNTTTAYAGARLIAQVLPNTTLRVSAGVEQDIASSIDNYAGSIYYLGSFSFNAPNTQKTRGFASVGADYWLAKNEKISLTGFANQQSLNNATATGALLSYTVGL
jgi:hypothetical protein